MTFRLKSGFWESSRHRPSYGSRRAMAVSNASSEHSRSNCSGFATSAISRNFTPLWPSSATAITAAGFSDALATALPPKHTVTSTLHYKLQRDSMSQLTPSDLSISPGPKQAVMQPIIRENVETGSWIFSDEWADNYRM